jgi:hypothetical protein
MKDLQDIKDLIKENVSLGDMFKTDGFITGLLEEEQLSCPFHGADRKKSARYYRETDTSYCWVCKEKLDVISYIQKKEGFSFNDAIKYLIKTYRIDISRLPEVSENNIKKIKERTIPKRDNRKYNLDKIKQAIMLTKDDIKYETFLKFIYLYMMLKYVVPEDKFDEQYETMRSGMKRVFDKIKKDK